MHLKLSAKLEKTSNSFLRFLLCCFIFCSKVKKNLMTNLLFSFIFLKQIPKHLHPTHTPHSDKTCEPSDCFFFKGNNFGNFLMQPAGNQCSFWSQDQGRCKCCLYRRRIVKPFPAPFKCLITLTFIWQRILFCGVYFFPLFLKMG